MGEKPAKRQHGEKSSLLPSACLDGQLTHSSFLSSFSIFLPPSGSQQLQKLKVFSAFSQRERFTSLERCNADAKAAEGTRPVCYQYPEGRKKKTKMKKEDETASCTGYTYCGQGLAHPIPFRNNPISRDAPKFGSVELG